MRLELGAATTMPIPFFGALRVARSPGARGGTFATAASVFPQEVQSTEARDSRGTCTWVVAPEHAVRRVRIMVHGDRVRVLR